MDLLPIINELGGGLSAVVTVVLGVAYWRARQALDALQEKRVADVQAMLEQGINAQHAAADALSNVSETVRQLTRELERRG